MGQIRPHFSGIRMSGVFIYLKILVLYSKMLSLKMSDIAQFGLSQPVLFDFSVEGPAGYAEPQGGFALVPARLFEGLPDQAFFDGFGGVLEACGRGAAG